MNLRLVAILMTTAFLVACSSGQEESPIAPTRIVVETAPATLTAVEEPPPTETGVMEVSEATPVSPAEEPAPAGATAETVVTIEEPREETPANNTEEGISESQEANDAMVPIEVTYFTPSQTEGPYYPVAKPEDQDNDLTVVDGAGGLPAGQIIQFTGKVYDASGMPAEGVAVEIWQTDTNGIYLHPGDPQTEQRDRNFQFYGEAITAADGSYSFRTILPGQYEPRPRHIHAKIKHEQQTLLTTQIYFEGDAALEADGIFLDSGNENIHLVVTLTAGQDEDGAPILVGEHDIILNTTLPVD